MKASVFTRINFERAKIEKASANANKRVLRKCGAYVRAIARKFVRHKTDPNIHSKPLHSPFDHFGLKNSIVFSSDSSEALIGPRYIKRGLSNVARLHEFGGEAIIKSIDRKLMNGVGVGDIAPVTQTYLKKNSAVSRKDMHKDPKTGKNVFWIRISTIRQAEHSTRLYRRMARKNTEKILVRYAPRPYMRPALEKSLPYLSGMWRNSIKN